MKIHSALGLRLCTVQHSTELSETLCMANKEKQVTGASGLFLLFNPRAVNGYINCGKFQGESMVQTLGSPGEQKS